jgi:hypothetical protein
LQYIHTEKKEKEGKEEKYDMRVEFIQVCSFHITKNLFVFLKNDFAVQK